MIKVLHIISTLQQTGPVMVLYNMLKYLERSQFLSTILTLSPEPTDTMLPRFAELDISINSLNLSRLQGLLTGPVSIKNFVVESQPDVIHLWGFRADLLALWGVKPNKRVSSLQNYPLDDYMMTYGPSKGRLMAWAHFLALSKSKYAVACSESVRQLVEAHQHLQNVVTIPNAVDEERFYPVTSEEKIRLRAKLNLSNNKTIFISVGQLSERKDPLTIIKSFLTKSWTDRCPQLIFVGDGPLREKCIEESQNCDDILFTGNIVNVSDYLRASDYYISASTAEGLPNAVLEGMACGLPVCLSDIEPHKELLNWDGQIGFHFHAGNPFALTEAINTLLASDRELMRQNELALVHHKLGAKHMAQQFQHLYSRLVSE